MPLRYVNYNCITTALALTSLGTSNLHSNQVMVSVNRVRVTMGTENSTRHVHPGPKITPSVRPTDLDRKWVTLQFTTYNCTIAVNRILK